MAATSHDLRHTCIATLTCCLVATGRCKDFNHHARRHTPPVRTRRNATLACAANLHTPESAFAPFFSGNPGTVICSNIASNVARSCRTTRCNRRRLCRRLVIQCCTTYLTFDFVARRACTWTETVVAHHHPIQPQCGHICCHRQPKHPDPHMPTIVVHTGSRLNMAHRTRTTVQRWRSS